MNGFTGWKNALNEGNPLYGMSSNQTRLFAVYIVMCLYKQQPAIMKCKEGL